MARDDYFRLVYIVLKTIEKNMKAGVITSTEEISHEALEIPYVYWASIMEELVRKDLVKGVDIIHGKGTGVPCVPSIRRPELTFEGMEFLQNNSAMKKIQEALKSMKAVIPNI